MNKPSPETQSPGTRAARSCVLELTVRNHPGVMSHVCGLFSRRGYNLEGILCMPEEGEDTSRMWLKVNEEQRLEQVVKQTRKLEDVLEVGRHAADHEVFVRLETFFRKAD